MEVKYVFVYEWLIFKVIGGLELVVKEIFKYINVDVYVLIDFELRNLESYFY